MDQALLVAPNGSPLLHIHGMEAFNPAMIGGPDNGILPNRADLELDFPLYSDVRGVMFNAFNRLVCPECHAPLRPADEFRTAGSARHAGDCDISLPDEKAPASVRLDRALRRRQPIILKLQIPNLKTGRVTKKEAAFYARLPKPPMVVTVRTATEWANFRARILATPGRYYRDTPKIEDRLAFYGRRLDAQRQEVDTRDPSQVRRLLLDIMSRTTKDKVRDGRRTDIFHPYLLTLALGANELPCPDAAASQTALLRVREGRYFKEFPLCRYGFPYAHVNFNVVSADEAVKSMLDGTVQVAATLDETKLRHQILSKQWRLAENGHLSIPVHVHGPAQIVARRDAPAQMAIM